MIKMGDRRQRRIALIAIAFFLAMPWQTAWADNDVGCGVGTLIWEGETGLAPKLAASFTNGLTFQSISITFGLVNCNGRNTVTVDAELRKFAAGNIDRLSLDMARGGGESLDTLANLMGVAHTDRNAFASLTQARFDRLFPSDRTTSGQMLSALNAVLREDEQLSRYARG